jgi:hypothetical protein
MTVSVVGCSVGGLLLDLPELLPFSGKIGRSVGGVLMVVGRRRKQFLSIFMRCCLQECSGLVF